MDVPVEIKKAIMCAAWNYKQVISANTQIREWLAMNHIDSDLVRDQLFECIENGSDRGHELILFFEDHSEDELYDGTDD
ncbi:hypothetical protein P8881_19520 [Bacillus haynesii]|uniref:hypothetical protein n=1 Tax=Bacillus haynesii TaxID=1925021 RepID=UPI00227DAF77|nr:hypothetical protein [Bacillus haynesii]MCY8737525.1 hypothetical protein [Bacillus haynesii]MEC0709716.1 hypothetical protein [Bacillus haynesii]MEC0736905.1 hypothetical protein [Bacillus haynesii]